MIALIAKRYWKEAAVCAVLLSIIAYAFTMRLQRDNIDADYTQYRQSIESALRAREMTNQLLKQQSDRRAALNDEIYAKQIEAMQSEIRRLAGSNAGLVSVNSGLLDAANSSRRALSALLASSRASSETERDCHERLADANRYIAVLTPACVQTDTDYKALRQAWDDECEIKGCE